jgi:hypothetical protein
VPVLTRGIVETHSRACGRQAGHPAGPRSSAGAEAWPGAVSSRSNVMACFQAKGLQYRHGIDYRMPL